MLRIRRELQDAFVAARCQQLVDELVAELTSAGDKPSHPDDASPSLPATDQGQLQKNVNAALVAALSFGIDKRRDIRIFVQTAQRLGWGFWRQQRYEYAKAVLLDKTLSSRWKVAKLQQVIVLQARPALADDESNTPTPQ